jgi:hypothetical protein
LRVRACAQAPGAPVQALAGDRANVYAATTTLQIRTLRSRRSRGRRHRRGRGRLLTAGLGHADRRGARGIAWASAATLSRRPARREASP